MVTYFWKWNCFFKNETVPNASLILILSFGEKWEKCSLGVHFFSKHKLSAYYVLALKRTEKKNAKRVELRMVSNYKTSPLKANSQLKHWPKCCNRSVSRSKCLDGPFSKNLSYCYELFFSIDARTKGHFNHFIFSLYAISCGSKRNDNFARQLLGDLCLLH